MKNTKLNQKNYLRSRMNNTIQKIISKKLLDAFYVDDYKYGKQLPDGSYRLIKQKITSITIEDMLKENGGIYSKGDDWNPYSVQEGNLITGQNPASSELVAEKILEKLA